MFAESAVDGFARCVVDGPLVVAVAHPAWMADRDDGDAEIVERLRTAFSASPDPAHLRSFFDDWTNRLFAGERLTKTSHG